VGFFSQVVVPRLCDFLLNKSLLARHRRELLATAQGDVLETGFGTSLNLPYFPERVHKLTAVDPNPGMHRLAQKRIKLTRIEVDEQVLGGERLPFEDSRFDCAVSTFTLCSIEDVAQALRAMSTAKTLPFSATSAANFRVNSPVPAPISATTMPGLSLQAATISLAWAAISRLSPSNFLR